MADRENLPGNLQADGRRRRTGSNGKQGKEAGGILGDPDGDFAVPGNLPKKVQKKSLQKTLVKKRKEVLQNCSFWGCGFPLKLFQ